MITDRKAFLAAITVLVIGSIIMFIMGCVCSADNSSNSTCGGAGLAVGIPLIFFGILFFAFTVGAVRSRTFD